MSDFKGNHVDQTFGQSWQHTANLASGLSVGQQFQIEEKLGDGGMGSVYKCKDLWLGRTVAIKFLHPHLASASVSLLRFRQEAKAAALLNHPGIARVHQLSFDTELPFIVMDYIEGRSLSEVLRSEGALEQGRALAIMSQVADALQHAHDQGVVHRDLKPSNILICPGDRFQVKVVDFGIAKIIAPEGESKDVPTLTHTGDLFGTPAYMSPEQLQGKDIDGRCDQYAFGCVLYECLTGAPPFTGSLVDVLFSHIKQVPLSLKEASIGNTFPPWLEAVVGRCLAKEREERFASMRELLEALNQPNIIIAPPEQGDDKRKARGRKPLVLGASFLLLLALGSVGIYYWGLPKKSALPAGPGPVEPLSQPDKPGPVNDYESSDARIEREEEKNKFVALVLYLAARGATEIKRPPGAFIGDDGLRCLINMPQLTALNLNNCVRISDAGMKTVLDIVQERRFNLKEISLHATFIKDRGLEFVSQISTLEKVYASNMSDISSHGVEALCRLPGLTTLSLEGDDQIGAAGLAALSGARSLSWLNLSGVNCRGSTRFLTHLPLKYLDLSNANLYDEDIDQIAKLEGLEQLKIKGNDKLSNRILTVLPRLKKLRQLSLSANGLDSGHIVEFLKKISPTHVNFANQ